ncbi:endonuclease III [Buchnera aphidicola (Hormaphis cornu)]|nr:endonuclease III [Buchnera aphidicola (Hormaphis cornu)]
MNIQIRLKILAALSSTYNNPTTELVYQSPFELLISVILSAQATDVSVNKATLYLYAIANTPQGILSIGIDNLKIFIKSIGLYRSKATYIIKTCKILLNKHQGIVPNNRTDLESLPGVGRKTANVILNTIFNQKVIAVDTHVFRVCNRTGFAVGKTVREVEQKLVKLVPESFKRNFHNLLIQHGRYICKARLPKCNICVIDKYCKYKINFQC